MKVKSLNCVQLFATPWTAAYQAPLSMGFSRQEYWSGLPLPSPTTLGLINTALLQMVIIAISRVFQNQDRLIYSQKNLENLKYPIWDL